MKDKRFERRYTVLKNEDIRHFLSRDEQDALDDMCNKVAAYRKAAGKQDLEGIFICSDWPEYEPAAKALHVRIARPVERFKNITPGALKLGERICAAVLTDECGEGCDVGAGIFGTELSQLVIEIASSAKPNVNVAVYKGHPNLADMISTHVDSLITILENKTVADDDGYIAHEIRALLDIKAAIEAEKSNG